MYKRKIYPTVKKYLHTDDIIVIHGARQVGKTSLMQLLMAELAPNEYYYCDLEDSRLLEICDRGHGSFIAYLRQKGLLSNQKKFYVFIDEVQYLKNPTELLKIIHDHYKNIKLVVSGSSSFDIKKKFKDSLVGRTVSFELYPLDFEEFLIFKKLKHNLHNDTLLVNSELKDLYVEYVKFGGYPKIVLAEALEIKEKYLQQIIDTYIKKDIRDLADIRHIDKFNKLLQVLAGQTGQLLNVTELSNTANIAKQTVEEYLFLLESTYVIRLVYPFHQSIRSELFKTPKVFFCDTGMIGLLAQKVLPSVVTGEIFETAIFSELLKNIGKDKINYWRTQDGKEIDFIINVKGKNLPVEVKLDGGKLSMTALRYFTEKYTPESQYCVCLDSCGKNKKEIKKIYPWEIYRLGIF